MRIPDPHDRDISGGSPLDSAAAILMLVGAVGGSYLGRAARERLDRVSDRGVPVPYLLFLLFNEITGFFAGGFVSYLLVSWVFVGA